MQGSENHGLRAVDAYSSITNLQLFGQIDACPFCMQSPFLQLFGCSLLGCVIWKTRPWGNWDDLVMVQSINLPCICLNYDGCDPWISKAGLCTLGRILDMPCHALYTVLDTRASGINWLSYLLSLEPILLGNCYK